MAIDIIRIFAFIFIVLLHTLNRQFGINVWMGGYAVISIGVNLFVMISGYLLLDKTEEAMVFFESSDCADFKGKSVCGTTFLVYLYDSGAVFSHTLASKGS